MTAAYLTSFDKDFRLRLVDMAFVVSEKIHARDNDSGAFFESITVSKEQVFAYCLHWKGKQIIVKARRQASGGDEPAIWIIQGVGSIHQYYPAYQFSDRTEFLEVLQLAIAALTAIPPNVDERPPSGVELSDHIATLSKDFPSGGINSGQLELPCGPPHLKVRTHDFSVQSTPAARRRDP